MDIRFNPTTKIGSKMGGEFTENPTKMGSQNGFDHSHGCSDPPLGPTSPDRPHPFTSPPRGGPTPDARPGTPWRCRRSWRVKSGHPPFCFERPPFFSNSLLIPNLATLSQVWFRRCLTQVCSRRCLGQAWSKRCLNLKLKKKKWSCSLNQLGPGSSPGG